MSNQNGKMPAQGSAPVGAPSVMPGQIAHQQMLGLMTNPAFAAAAPIFPPAAMMAHPGAFLAMPEAFATGASAASASALALGMHSAGLAPSAAAFDQTQSHALAMSGMSASPYGHQPGPLPLPPMAPASAGGASIDAKGDKNKRPDMSADERARQNRDRNREHARSTRLRKKAYVQKLKELVECLHAERTEEVRQRRVAIQHLAETQSVRRAVVRTFLRFLSKYEADERKWSTIVEENFWFKQPVTPYRSFRRAEIERECRVSRGIDSMICDSASLVVMIECIGSRSSRWMQMKREEFLLLEESKRGNRKVPCCILRQESRLQHAVSSLSSSSGSSNHASSGEDTGNRNKGSQHWSKGAGGLSEIRGLNEATQGQFPSKVSGSSGSSNEGHVAQGQPNDFHDYDAKPLPDPTLADSERSSGGSPSPDDSPEESNAGSEGPTKRISADSSSGDDSACAIAETHAKRRRVENASANQMMGDPGVSLRAPSNLPPNIAKKGGIPHNIRPVEPEPLGNGNVRLRLAPAIPLPPFAGIGKRSPIVGLAINPPRPAPSPGDNRPASSKSSKAPESSTPVGPVVISADLETSSSDSEGKVPQIRAYFHINEDDMIIMEDVLMCPFVFRSQDAVLCGALAECVMPGMIRAHFSPRNKLFSLELVYDAMGFMQQLERASGNEGTAQIIPGSLEMALAPTTSEARVITLAEPPFLIVNVNEVWTKTTGYTQVEVEGREYLRLLEGEGTVHEARERAHKPPHDLEEVARGRSACSTNIHYDKDGRDFIEFVCSYPLTKKTPSVFFALTMWDSCNPSNQTFKLMPVGDSMYCKEKDLYSMKRTREQQLASIPLLPRPALSTMTSIPETPINFRPMHFSSRSSPYPSDGMINKHSRKPSATEKLQRSRERNRIHARKTRQRKKEQMQHLQSRADCLKAEQIRLKQLINEKHTANILVRLLTTSSDAEVGNSHDDPAVEELLLRPVEEIPDASKIPELPALILPGQHASKKLKYTQMEDVSSNEAGVDGIDYELLGKDRSKCSQEELDKIKRERNRMHAKRTRDRKRLFMEEMSEVCRLLEEENEVLRCHLEKIDPEYTRAEVVSSDSVEPTESPPSVTPALSSPKIQPCKSPEDIREDSSEPCDVPFKVSNSSTVCFDQLKTLLEAAGSVEILPSAEKRQQVNEIICSFSNTVRTDSSASSSLDDHARAFKRRRLTEASHAGASMVSFATAEVGC